MIAKRIISIVVSLLLLLFWSCESKKESPNKPQTVAEEKLPEINLDIQRIDVEMRKAAKEFKNSDKKKLDKAIILQKYDQHFKKDKIFLATWLYEQPKSFFDTIPSIAIDTNLALDFVGNLTHPEVLRMLDTLGKYYPENYNFENLLKEPFQRLKYYFPDFEVPKIRTIFWGVDQRRPWDYQLNVNSVYYHENHVGIGLEYFCSPYLTLIHPETPRYVRKRYTPQKLPVAVFSKIAQSIIKGGKKKKSPPLIDLMIQEGIRYYLLDLVLPDTPDSTKIHYTPVQFQNATAAIPDLYQAMVPLLYSENFFDYQWCVAEGPSTSRFGADMPSRLGSFIGWQIVRNYMKNNPKVTLAQLVTEKDYQKILKESKFKPK